VPPAIVARVTVEQDVVLADGRSVHVFDSGPRSAPDAVTLVWHHGSPQTGAFLDPVRTAAERRGIRLVSYARPSYGGSTPQPGRAVATAGADVAEVLDALGVGRFATMGASGGGPHALACAAAAPDRVVGVVTLAGIAPYDESDWFAGMADATGPRTAQLGREARLALETTAQFDPAIFTTTDWAALDGPWASLGADAGRAGQAGPDGLVDDDVAFVNDWGFALAEVTGPVLVVQGGQNRVVPPSHADRLVRSCPAAQFWLRPLDGHISVLNAVPVAMDWLLDLQ
jgi:pimeloyl-ACP methyl ester carboxylesterase